MWQDGIKSSVLTFLARTLIIPRLTGARTSGDGLGGMPSDVRHLPFRSSATTERSTAAIECVEVVPSSASQRSCWKGKDPDCRVLTGMRQC